jgi:hypothetical protein
VKDIQNKDVVAKFVKAALPHHEAHIDTFDDAAYHYHLDGRKQRSRESFLIARRDVIPTVPVSRRAVAFLAPLRSLSVGCDGEAEPQRME